MFSYHLNIAGVPLQVHTEQPLEIGRAFSPFLSEKEGPACHIRFQSVQELPDIPEEFLYQGISFRVHRNQDGWEVRSFYKEPSCKNRYAVGTFDYKAGEIQITYLKSADSYVSSMRNCFSHIVLEAILLQYDRLCFHGACIRTGERGIVFTGPSGVGKSTQAELWCRYRNALQINGDRPVLSYDSGSWRGWGSPFAGSSLCYVNESTKIDGIVLLKQSPVCSCRRLSQGEAFRCIYSGITANRWSAEYMHRACELITDLISRIPVYEFSCTADENAVIYMENILRKELTE